MRRPEMKIPEPLLLELDAECDGSSFFHRQSHEQTALCGGAMAWGETEALRAKLSRCVHFRNDAAT